MVDISSYLDLRSSNITPNHFYMLKMKLEGSTPEEGWENCAYAETLFRHKQHSLELTLDAERAKLLIQHSGGKSSVTVQKAEVDRNTKIIDLSDWAETMRYLKDCCKTLRLSLEIGNNIKPNYDKKEEN